MQVGNQSTARKAPLARTRHHLPVPLRSLVAMVLMVLMALGAACASDRATSGPTAFPVILQVANHLVAPVTIAVDGVPIVGLQGGASTSLTVSSTAQWLTWTSAKPTNSRGQPIPDDIAEVRVLVAGINRLLEISNVINDQTYITAGILNYTNAPVSIGVFGGTSVSCAAELPAKIGGAIGFTRIGYYVLLPATELRAYRDPSSCSGPYVAWSSSLLNAFSGKSGVLTLSLDSAP